LNNNDLNLNFDNNVDLVKEILITRNTKVLMINLFEFQITGPTKFYQFKLTNTDKNIIDWVKIIEGMIDKINQKMNDMKIITLNKSNHSLVNLMKESKSKIVKTTDEIHKSNSEYNNLSGRDKGLFKISESQEDEYTENSSDKVNLDNEQNNKRKVRKSAKREKRSDKHEENEDKLCITNINKLSINMDDCNINDISKIDTTGQSNSNQLLTSQSPRGRVHESQSINNLQEECK